jgi:hypothetical protein
VLKPAELVAPACPDEGVVAVQEIAYVLLKISGHYNAVEVAPGHLKREVGNSQIGKNPITA